MMPLGWSLRQHLVGPVPGDQFGVDLLLAHAAADQLAVLAAVIEHGDGLMLHGG